MADIDVSDTYSIPTYDKHLGSTYIAIDDLNALFFFIEGNEKSILVANTTDGGASWNAPDSDQSIDQGNFSYEMLATWYSKWTPSHEADTLIYMCFGSAGGDVGEYACKVNPNGTLNGSVIKAASSGEFIGDNTNAESSICLAEDGDVYMFAKDGGAWGLWRSTDDLATAMSSVASDTMVNGLAGEIAFRNPRIIPSPGNANDIMLLAVLLTGEDTAAYIIWDDAAQAWGSWVTLGVIHSVGGDNVRILDAGLRIADRKAFITYLTSTAAAQATLRMFCVGPTMQTTQLVDVVEPQDPDRVSHPSLSIDQQTGHIFVSYRYLTDATGFFTIRYKLSRQSGNSWADEVLWGAAANADLKVMHVPLSTPAFDQSFFQPIWWDENLEKWRTSTTDIVVTAGGYTVRELADGGSDQQIVDCDSGMMSSLAGPTDLVRMAKTPYPTLGDKFGTSVLITWIPYLTKSSGAFAVGDTVQGATSKATGIIYRFLTNPLMIGLTTVKNGPGPGKGFAFRPNELINNQTQAGQLTTPSSLRAVTSPGVQPSSARESSDDI